mmetsp:Transcript_33575/g.69864  ORF Transcript_33575/g.69864 Transcript_33575/m.69864 type:complete len:89 (+) Transcript_33575:581-847(+)
MKYSNGSKIGKQLILVVSLQHKGGIIGIDDVFPLSHDIDSHFNSFGKFPPLSEVFCGLNMFLNTRPWHIWLDTRPSLACKKTVSFHKV